MYSQDVGTEFGWLSNDWTNNTVEDYTFNGLYCLSGLAYPESEYIAKCTETEYVTFDDEEISNPW